ncbi:hypothetical protein BJ165DRAFT_1420760 [Panaeolus papilionaceus]|nr:hypothetical protein BJ165DRAFT_1420760 [Panaeolus papilionaceus]
MNHRNVTDAKLNCCNFKGSVHIIHIDMSAPNINDPTSINALLEQLKSSTAWQQLTSSQTQGDTSHVLPSADLPRNPSNTSPSVADLLSQLSSVSEPAPAIQSSVQQRPTVSAFSASVLSSGFGQRSNTTPLLPPSLPATDVQNLTFVQSLPLISQLAGDPAFLSAVAQMKNDQDDLERKLWAEREAIYNKYHSKFKGTQTKANLIGTSVSQHEIDMMTDSFKKEIARFDVDRVLPAWDGLVSRQQQELAQLNLPTMFITTENEDRERQQQVINVLENIIGQKP